MDAPSTTLIAIGLLALVFVIAPVAADVYFRFRRRRAVVCPDTALVADVQIDAWHAAATAFPGPPRLHLVACTFWPEREGCERKCVPTAQMR